MKVSLGNFTIAIGKEASLLFFFCVKLERCGPSCHYEERSYVRKVGLKEGQKNFKMKIALRRLSVLN